MAAANLWAQILAWSDEALSLNLGKMGKDLFQFALEKLKQVWQFMEAFCAQLLVRFDEAFSPHLRDLKKEDLVNFMLEKWRQFSVRSDEMFPPEKRSELLRRGSFILAVSAVAYFMYRCCCCGGGGGGGNGKMMKAPGRSRQMPRAAFAASPKSYFRGLHADKKKSR